jgi:hypothetical protein
MVQSRPREIVWQRGRQAASSLLSFSSSNPPFARELKLPDWDQSNRLVWPPKQESIASIFMSTIDHPGATWWDRNQQEQQKQPEQDFDAAYHMREARHTAAAQCRRGVHSWWYNEKEMSLNG